MSLSAAEKEQAKQLERAATKLAEVVLMLSPVPVHLSLRCGPLTCTCAQVYAKYLDGEFAFSNRRLLALRRKLLVLQALTQFRSKRCADADCDGLD